MTQGALAAPTNPVLIYTRVGPDRLYNARWLNFHRGTRWASGHFFQTGFNTVIPPNGSTYSSNGQVNWNDGEGLRPAASHHPGGVNAALLDGSVRFVPNTIDTGNLALAPRDSASGLPSPYGVWGAMGSKNGGEVIQQ